MDRTNTKRVKIGNVVIGGQNKVYIQSMCNIKTSKVKSVVKQILELEELGCDIIRVSVLDEKDAKAIKKIKEQIHIPLVADIHFSSKLALLAIDSGASKIRLNPGNIENEADIARIITKCKEKDIAIRIGVNSGSLEKNILAKYGKPVPMAFVESALESVKILNRYDFDDIVISIKSSDVKTTIEAYRLLAERCDYPLHLGVTETGTARMGIIKSAIGIGSLLCDGIGDTIRVSLTAPPIEEIKAAKDILRAVGIGGGVNIVACPTCGRTQIDLISLANRVEEAVAGVEKNITVAVMGCVVNGPGEAREADIGIAGGKGEALIFRKGEVIKKVPEDKILEELLKEIETI